jgi:hypothetical protein
MRARSRKGRSRKLTAAQKALRSFGLVKVKFSHITGEPLKNHVLNVHTGKIYEDTEKGWKAFHNDLNRL